MLSVIFEVLPAAGSRDDYLASPSILKPILESIDGFVDTERSESRRRPGWVLSHSTWRDETSAVRWRVEAEHHATQARGRCQIFKDYRLARRRGQSRHRPAEPGADPGAALRRDRGAQPR